MTNPARSPRSVRTSRLSATFTASILLSFLAGCAGEPPGLDEVATNEAAPPSVAAAPPVAAAPVAKTSSSVRVETVAIEARALVDEIELVGELRANESVELRSQANGHVTALYFEEGARVSRHDLLVKIDDAALVAERKRAAVRLDFARLRETRARTLRDEETISQEVYEESASRVAELEAELGLIDTRIAQTEVRAPFSGVIGLRAISIGAYLTPNVPVATLHALDPIKLDLAAPERYAQRIRVGERVQFQITGSDAIHQGTIYATEPRIDRESRTLRIRARADNPDATLFPGAFIRARLTLGTPEHALMVPSIALIPGLETTTVYVVEAGHAQPRSVRTGVRTEDLVEIVDGLDAGDEVIVSGVLRVEPGAAVSVAP